MKNRLRQLREEQKLTQKELATKLNLSKPTISKYEDGSVDMSSETLTLCSKMFNCSIDYLLHNTDNRSYKEEYSDTLTDEITQIVKKYDLLEIEALKTILASDISLIKLKDMLARFEEVFQKKS